MAVYDGFFDASFNEETGEYDRAYSSGDFTDYFGQIVGTGVCINDDPDSCKVWLENGRAFIHTGYLFIQGYWLRVKDEPYAIDLTGTAPLAIVAYLNTGKRMIELEARAVAESYPYALVLAIVDPAAGTVEDTRYDTAICGVIDSAGGLSDKAAYALNYIDTEVDGRLKQMEASIAAQNAKLDEKIVQAQESLEKIKPLPVGIIKFSAAQSMGEEWLRCDGSTIEEKDYPDLVNMLYSIPGSGAGFDEAKFYWSQAGLPTRDQWRSVTYGNGVFVAVGGGNYNDGKVAYSEDGKTWVETYINTAEVWSSVTYGNGLFVAVAIDDSNKVAYSGDGKIWTETTLPSSGNWISAAYGNGMFVAVAGDTTVDNKAAYSKNGKTWTGTTLPSSHLWKSVAYGNGVFVAVGGGYNDDSNKAAYSADGKTWVETYLTPSGSWSSVTFGNGMFVAVADGDTRSSTGRNKSACSKDGKTWTETYLPPSGNWSSVTYGNGLFVTVSRESDSNKVAYSEDGKTWAETTLPTSGSWISTAYGNGMFVAITRSGAAAYCAPFSSARLPNMTLSNIPAYIKAKPSNSEGAAS